MSNNIEDDQDLLSKVSRQLSDLPASPVASQPEVDTPWTQFSGIPSEPGHNTFTKLYTWNPATLSHSNLSSSTGENFSSQASQNPSEGSGLTQDIGNNYYSQFSWNGKAPANQAHRFHESVDAGARFSRDQSQFQGGHFNRQHQSFGHSSYLHQEASLYPGGQPPSLGFGSSDSFNLQYQGTDDSFGGPNQFPHQNLNQNFSADFEHLPKREGFPGHFRHSLSYDGATSHLQGLQATPTFDPRTPPPHFPLERQHSEDILKPRQSSTHTANDIVDYLKLNSPTSVGLDLGINIERGAAPCRLSDLDTVNASSDEGRSMYAEALSKWNAFEPTKSLIRESSETPLTQSVLNETLSEPSSPDLSKPSYSEIAKTPKVSHPPLSKTDQPHDFCSRIQTSRAARKDPKSSRPFIRRASSGSKFWPRGGPASEIEQPKVSPTSRYGLDSFDVTELNPGSHNSSMECLSQRRGSGSSGSSCISGLDDTPSSLPKQATSADVGSQGRTQSTSSVQNKLTSGSTGAKPPASQKQTKPVTKQQSHESVFFDPKRIFQPKVTNRSQNVSKAKPFEGRDQSQQDKSLNSSASDTILNNGKPTSSSSSSKLPSTAKRHDYINNDLRDSSKVTNQTVAESGLTGKEKQEDKKEPRSAKRSGRTNGSYRRKKSPEHNHKPEEDASNCFQAEANDHRVLPVNFDTVRLEELFGFVTEKISHWGNLLVNGLLSLLIYALGLVIYISSVAVHFLGLILGKLWMLIKTKIFRVQSGSDDSGFGWRPRDHLQRRVGLEENINLPSTGEEAMKRLLACKGKDPYSILGLRVDASDEDIKKYYRKQAVLVHPDKNQEPGAEEAFKILGHAFEMIGEPTKRKSYDSHTQEENEADAMREFAEMLSKLQAKIQEAANIMRCDTCSSKHRRVPVDRPFYSARFCERCNVHHAAKEGDVWAESTMCGFLWHYYALMEGRVFDITEWMKCHREFFKHMRANDHVVMFRIATDGNRKPRHNQTGEANLEDFINRLFNKSTGGVPPEASHPGHGSSAATGHDQRWAQTGSGAAAAAARKSGRRKKKRHP